MTNAQVVHVWAQGGEERGKNSGGTIFFEGDTIYSYGYHFWMAHRTHGLTLVNSARHSVTTSAQQSLVRQAIIGTYIEVPYMNAMPDEIDKNLKWFKERIAEIVLQGARARTDFNKNIAAHCAHNLTVDANVYAKAMGRRNKFKLPDAELLKERAKKAQKREARAKKKRDAELTIEVLKWEKGKEIHCSLWNAPVGMRIKADGETVETSQGAQFPLEHARRAYPLVKACRDRGETFQSNGHTIKLGYFQISSIDKKGNVRAGCHYVTWEAIARFAPKMGL